MSKNLLSSVSRCFFVFSKALLNQVTVIVSILCKI